MFLYLYITRVVREIRHYVQLMGKITKYFPLIQIIVIKTKLVSSAIETSFKCQ